MRFRFDTEVLSLNSVLHDIIMKIYVHNMINKLETSNKIFLCNECINYEIDK
jgi:hypothetical protein